MKEIQRRAEYVCQALYFFGKKFCCLWTYAVYKGHAFFRDYLRSCRFFLKPPEQAPLPYPQAACHKR